jgi:indole-3-glycerol phosphate synthase
MTGAARSIFVALERRRGDARGVRVDDAAVRLRREQNLAASRPDTRAITPSIRNFAQAIDRQRQAVEYVPSLRASRPRLAEAARALDEAEVAALAIVIENPAAELAVFSAAAAAVSVPVLRSDLILEEFQIYQSRAAGADAVLLHARLLPGEQLERLCGAARATHMAACVACETVDEMQRAGAARAAVVALSRPDEALYAAVPRRLQVLALEPFAAQRGRVDALLDESIGDAADPAAKFRALLEGG